MRVLKIWVFGSTAKGSLNPNDLDLLIRMRADGVRQTWREAGVDPEYLRSCGIKAARDPKREAYMWLTRGMRMVSRHDFDVEMIEIDVKLLLWPKMDRRLMT